MTAGSQSFQPPSTLETGEISHISPQVPLGLAGLSHFSLQVPWELGPPKRYWRVIDLRPENWYWYSDDLCDTRSNTINSINTISSIDNTIDSINTINAIATSTSKRVRSPVDLASNVPL